MSKFRKHWFTVGSSQRRVDKSVGQRGGSLPGLPWSFKLAGLFNHRVLCGTRRGGEKSRANRQETSLFHGPIVPAEREQSAWQNVTWTTQNSVIQRRF